MIENNFWISTEPQHDIIPGEYTATIGGYSLIINFHNGNSSPIIKMNNGLRGFGVVKVRVGTDGYVRIFYFDGH